MWHVYAFHRSSRGCASYVYRDKRPPWSFGEASRPFTRYVFCSVRCKKNCLQCYYPGFSSASMLEPLAEKSGSPKAPMQANGVQNSPSANKWIGVWYLHECKLFKPWCGLPRTGVCPAYHVRSSSMLLARIFSVLCVILLKVEAMIQLIPSSTRRSIIGLPVLSIG